jgi:hypothetical protein
MTETTNEGKDLQTLIKNSNSKKKKIIKNK